MSFEVRTTAARPCGLRGVPKLVALSSDGATLARPAITSNTATSPPAWVRLSAAHPLAVSGATFPGDPARCSNKVAKFAIPLSHSAGTVVIPVPKDFGCLSTHADGSPYPVEGVSWDRPNAPELRRYENISPTLVRVQRRAHPGGLEHFSLRFTGNIRLLLHPCMRVTVQLVPDGPPVAAHLRTLLNCKAVPHGPLQQVTFDMQIRVPRRTPKLLDVDVDWPVSLDDISDVLDNGQYRPIRITSR
jgi:hypothetical protein